MFSKQEASQLRKDFWTKFGLYMKPVPFAEGEKNNWINYKTGEKDIAFKMDVPGDMAIISIEISHKDLSGQQQYFEQFFALKKMLEQQTKEPWIWELHREDDFGKIVSRIYATKEGVHIFNKGTWPLLISFFKPRIIALDAFWNQARYAFEALK